MTQSLYDARSASNKFVPVIFGCNDEPHIPEPLRSQTFYVLDSAPNYQSLYDALLNQSGVAPGPIGSLKRMPRVVAHPLAFGLGRASSNCEQAICGIDEHLPIGGNQINFAVDDCFVVPSNAVGSIEELLKDSKVTLLSITGLACIGKSSLTRYCLQKFRRLYCKRVTGIFYWDFVRNRSSEDFLRELLQFADSLYPSPARPSVDQSEGSAFLLVGRVKELLRKRSLIVVLDGLETHQRCCSDVDEVFGLGNPMKTSRAAAEAPVANVYGGLLNIDLVGFGKSVSGPLRDEYLHAILSLACDPQEPLFQSLIIVTSRLPLIDFSSRIGPRFRQLDAKNLALTSSEGAQVLELCGFS